MSAITKLIVSTILNQGVKGSEIKDWHFNVREVNGVYIVDVSTTVTISPKTQLTKPEKMSKYLILAWVISFLIWVSLSAVGALLPNANFGRDIILWSGLPGFIAQLIGARFLIKSYRKYQAEQESTQAILNAQERARAGSSGADKPGGFPTSNS